MIIRCPICDQLFEQNQLREHCAIHNIPINGYREENCDQYQEYIGNVTVLLTYVEILRMFVQKMRTAYVQFSLMLQANGLPSHLIPRIDIETMNFATAMNINLPSEVEDLVCEVSHSFLDDIGFGDLHSI